MVITKSERMLKAASMLAQFRECVLLVVRGATAFLAGQLRQLGRPLASRSQARAMEERPLAPSLSASGWLVKEKPANASMFSQSRRRWFELSGHKLVYREQQDSTGSPKGEVDMRLHSMRPHQTPLTLEIVPNDPKDSPRGNFVLVASNELEFTQWTDALSALFTEEPIAAASSGGPESQTRPTTEQRLRSAAAVGGLTFDRYLSVITSVLGQDEDGNWTETPQESDEAVRLDFLQQFKRLDIDGDGILTVEELLHDLSSPSSQPVAAPATLEPVRAQVDDPGSVYSYIDEESSPPPMLTRSQSAPAFLQEDPGYWTEKFHSHSSNNDVDQLAKLADDFVCAAKHYAKIIIIERMIKPVEKKTIKPVAASGIAGGEKYVVHSILFKFATREGCANLYPSDELAMKAAGHDMRGLSAVYQSGVPGLRTPLMCLVDYRGFRVQAVSLLPINGDKTLMYGSSDGCLTLKTADHYPSFIEKIRQLAALNNIAPHQAGNGGISKEMLLPGDIEGHTDKTRRGDVTPGSVEDHFYLLDFARLFPPEAPMEEVFGVFQEAQSVDLDNLLDSPAPIDSPPIPVGRSNSVISHSDVSLDHGNQYLWKLLRPALVKRWRQPLSPDSFSPFGDDKSDTAKQNGEVVKCTADLILKKLPSFASFLYRKFFEGSPMVLSEIMGAIHTAGINYRHVGRIRNCLLDKIEDERSKLSQDDIVRVSEASDLLMIEVLARSMKNDLRLAWREANNETTTCPRESFSHNATLRYLNAILGNANVDPAVDFHVSGDHDNQRRTPGATVLESKIHTKINIAKFKARIRKDSNLHLLKVTATNLVAASRERRNMFTEFLQGCRRRFPKAFSAGEEESFSNSRAAPDSPDNAADATVLFNTELRSRVMCRLCQLVPSLVLSRHAELQIPSPSFFDVYEPFQWQAIASLDAEVTHLEVIDTAMARKSVRSYAGISCTDKFFAFDIFEKDEKYLWNQAEGRHQRLLCGKKANGEAINGEWRVVDEDSYFNYLYIIERLTSSNKSNPGDLETLRHLTRMEALLGLRSWDLASLTAAVTHLEWLVEMDYYGGEGEDAASWIDFCSSFCDVLFDAAAFFVRRFLLKFWSGKKLHITVEQATDLARVVRLAECAAWCQEMTETQGKSSVRTMTFLEKSEEVDQLETLEDGRLKLGQSSKIRHGSQRMAKRASLKRHQSSTLRMSTTKGTAAMIEKSRLNVHDSVLLPQAGCVSSCCLNTFTNARRDQSVLYSGCDLTAADKQQHIEYWKAYVNHDRRLLGSTIRYQWEAGFTVVLNLIALLGRYHEPFRAILRPLALPYSTGYFCLCVGALSIVACIVLFFMSVRSLKATLCGGSRAFGGKGGDGSAQFFDVIPEAWWDVLRSPFWKAPVVEWVLLVVCVSAWVIPIMWYSTGVFYGGFLPILIIWSLVPLFLWSALFMHTMRVLYWLPCALLGMECPYTSLSTFYAVANGVSLSEVVPGEAKFVKRGLTVVMTFLRRYYKLGIMFIFLCSIIILAESENDLTGRVNNASDSAL